jgi:1-acyl-sn-glycerol-3-phosphate acyltransferase
MVNATAAPVPPRAARPGIRRWLAGSLLSLLGWRLEVAWPTVPRCIIIVYPHTSNWDFLVGYLAKVAAGVPGQWIGKDTIFRWPVAGLLRRMGGIPVDRKEPSGLIRRLAKEFDQRPFLWLVMAPEGTRSRTEYIKSGFYRLALSAGVPVGLAVMDWSRRVLTLQTYLTLSGEEASDLARIRETYAGAKGFHPEQASPIRFRPARDTDR